MEDEKRFWNGTSRRPDTTDLEAVNPPTPKQPQDRNLVTWSSDTDPEYPRNWAKSIKWKNTWTISLFVFISPISSSMIAPALQDLGELLHMETDFEIYLSMAIFILAYAIGQIFLGPALELYGRAQLLQASNLWYMAWNLGCGSAMTKAQLFAFRSPCGAQNQGASSSHDCHPANISLEDSTTGRRFQHALLVLHQSPKGGAF
ncbi:major facilitator superfamily domain-containing protein [Aspergillus pseudodeflectus]|uniref:Major facilitator superfamily domain-containing protein n=1 Tax=Aspergillus pseudodeflectus TaxID=176178 RepID=A0ABR4KA85_9EURO